jgi:hypothetical protein
MSSSIVESRSAKSRSFYPTTGETAALVNDHWRKNIARQHPSFDEQAYTYVSPTSGTGVMTNGFIDAQKYDIVPQHPSVQKCDYKMLDLGQFGSNVIIYENPPFDKENLVPFFNAMALDDCVKIITLILPDRCRADQTSSDWRTCFNEYFHLDDYLQLPYGSFECADKSVSQIQTSFQIWKRMPTPRVYEDIGVLVGQHNIPSPLIKIGWEMFYVARFNPQHGPDRAAVTRSRPKKQSPKPIMVSVRMDIPDRLELVQRAVELMWREYPHHAKLSLHAGNLKNAFNSIMVVSCASPVAPPRGCKRIRE